MNKILADYEKTLMRAKMPEFSPGDTISVNVKVVEGNKERIQTFTGTVMQRRGDGLRATFTVRKISGGVAVERIFPVYSPIVSSVTLDRKGKIRRAKLFYLRKLEGKAARITEVRKQEKTA